MGGGGGWGGHLATYLRLSLGHSPRPSVMTRGDTIYRGHAQREKKVPHGTRQARVHIPGGGQSTCGLLARGR